MLSVQSGSLPLPLRTLVKSRLCCVLNCFLLLCCSTLCLVLTLLLQLKVFKHSLFYYFFIHITLIVYVWLFINTTLVCCTYLLYYMDSSRHTSDILKGKTQPFMKLTLGFRECSFGCIKLTVIVCRVVQCSVFKV